MNRNYCRKPVHELGRTARYYLRQERANRRREENIQRLEEHDRPGPAGPADRIPAEPDLIQQMEMEPRPVADNDRDSENNSADGQLVDNSEVDAADGVNDDEDPIPYQEAEPDDIDMGNQQQDEQEHVEVGSESGDEHSGDEQDLDRDNHPLYAGAEVTVGDTMMVTLSLMLRHNLSLSCISDFLYALQLICPTERYQSISLYKFKKFFKLNKKQVFKKHYYCSVCQTSLQDKTADCDVCVESGPKGYFIELPFVTHFQEMLKRENFWNLLQHRLHEENVGNDVIQDICDGSLYRTQENITGISLTRPDCLSFMWYTDGVPVFKSSNTSMWPIYLLINELPYRERIKHENILLAGLWFGKKKPNANLFFMKLRPQFESLVHGKNFALPNQRNINLKIVLLAGVGDIPAKTHFLSLTLFSGAYGCTNCKLRGYTYQEPENNEEENNEEEHNRPKTKKGHNHVYPYEKNIAERNSEETIQQANQVINHQMKDGLMGVKGLTVLSQIMPDFIGGMGIDVMHKVYGGCVKRLLHFWFDSGHSKKPFSLREHINNIDQRLLCIKPPKFVHRMPRSVVELCHWKCSELKVWFYYFSLPVLSGIMQHLYLNHFTLLIYSISLLNSNAVTQAEKKRAEKLLHRFVREYPILYGEKYSTINVHGLLHLSSCVARLGPLWAYSCFPLEDLNGKLLNHVHGTSNLDHQIATRHSQLIKLHNKLETINEGPIKDFLLNSKRREATVNQRIFAGCYSLGTHQTLEQMPENLLPLLESLNMEGTVRTYCKLLKDSKVYVSESYNRNLKTNSAFVQYERNGKTHFGCILVFLKVTHCECEDGYCLCDSEHYAVIEEVRTRHMFEALDGNISHPLWHLKICHRTNDKKVVPVRDLRCVCFYLVVEGSPPIIGLPINDKEKE